MNATHSQSWNYQNLTQFGCHLGVGYDPGLGDNRIQSQTWTTNTRLRVANMLGHGYNPGL
jgi:hypothetical protein